MSNPGVIELASTVIGGTCLRIEDNIGEAIHLHFGNMRIDMTVKKFLRFAEALADCMEKMVAVPYFSLSKFDARFLLDAVSHILALEKIEFRDVSVSELKTDSRGTGGKERLVPIANSRIMSALHGDTEENEARCQVNYWGDTNRSRLKKVRASISKYGYMPEKFGNYIVLMDEGRYVYDGCHRASCVLDIYGDIKIKTAMWHTKGQAYTDARKEQELAQSNVNVRSSLRNVFRFVKRKKRIYIYGAGHYGMLCHKLLELHGTRVEGFVATMPADEEFLGSPVIRFGELLPELRESDGIVLAMNYQNSQEVWPVLQASDVDVQMIPESVFRYLVRTNLSNSNAELRRFARRYPAAPHAGSQGWQNILVVRIDRMGDMIWTSAFFRELRRNFPKAKITTLIEKNNMMLMEHCPYVDRVIGFSAKDEYNRWHYWQLFHYIRKIAADYFQDERFDAVFLPRGIMRADLPSNMASNLFFAINSGADERIANWFYTKERIGKRFGAAISPLFSHVANHEVPKHDVSKILDMLRELDCKIASERTELWPGELRDELPYGEEIKLAKSRGDKIAVLGISGRDGQRAWSPVKFRKLMGCLSKAYGIMFLLCGDKSAVDNATRMRTDNCLDLTGKTDLRQMLRITELADLYIGVDTGLIHIAAALGKPCLEISSCLPWGCSNDMASPVRCAPWQTKSIIVQPEEAMDDVCAEKGYCVNSRPHCINTITVERVAEAAKKLMEEITSAGA